MAFSSSASLPAEITKVVALLSSEDFARQISAAAGGTLDSFTLTGDIAEAFQVKTQRSLPSEGLPDMVKKFMGTTITVELTEQWSAPEADGSRTVQLLASVAGAPVKAEGTERLQAQGAETAIDLSGSVTCNIPIFGEKIARAAEPGMAQALELQITEAKKVLS